jgi:outer membrane receptor for ferrienterochelin and colicins
MFRTFTSPSSLARSCAFALALLLLIAGSASARAGRRVPDDGRLRGHVTDAQSGQPVQAARVVVRTSLGNVITGAITDDSGAYVIASLPAGTYSVEASRLGYERQSQFDVRVAVNEERVLDFQLTVVALQAGKVVVTSARRVERVADSDASVSIVDGERVGQRTEATVFGSLKTVKGLDYFEAGLGQQQVNARGFVNPFTTNVLVLVDNRLAALPGLGTVLPGLVTASQNDVAQVEVVTGPTSALYGANAGNGVVNVVTRDPRQSSGASMSITAGERDLRKVDARVSGMLGERAGYKLAAGSYQANDFERRNAFSSGAITALDDPDFRIDNRSVNGSLYLYPAAGSRLVYSGGLTRANYVNLTVVSRLQLRDWEAWYHQLRANFDDLSGFGSLFVQGYYTGNDAGDSYYLDVYTRSMLPLPAGQALPPDAAMQRARFVDRGRRYDLEAQHTIQFGGKHFVTSGAMWRRTLPNSGGTYLVDGPGDPGVRIDETGVYAGYDNLVLPRTKLTLVARYDTHSDHGARFSPKAAVAYSVTPDHVVRASYNKAFNSPNIYLLYARSQVGRSGTYDVFIRGNRDGVRFVNTAGGATPSTLPGLEPLNIDSYELGYRGTFAQRLFVDAAVYRTDYRNYISKEATVSSPQDSVFVLDPTTGQPLREITRTYVNYGELPVLGTDLSAQWLVTPRFSVNGSFSYQDPGTFRKPILGLSAPPFNAPTHKSKGGIAYRDWWRVGSYAELSGQHVSSYYFQSSLAYLTGVIPTYDVVDADLGVPLPWVTVAGTRLGVSVKNLLDRRHFEVPGGATLGRVASLTLTLDW